MEKIVVERELNKWKNKYPDIFDGNYISLRYLGDKLNIYNELKKRNDYKSITILGLQDFSEDLPKICNPDWLKKERRAKLQKINERST